MPIHVSHAHVRYVRGAIQGLPNEAKARILQGKLNATGLMDALRELYRKVRGHELSDEYGIHQVDLLDDVRQSVRVVLYDGGKRLTFDMLRLNPEAEIVFDGIARLADLPHAHAVPADTPRGDFLALVAVPDGEDLLSSDVMSDEYFRTHWPWLTDEVAAQEALADFLGVAVRSDSYVVDTSAHTVYATDHLELFHHLKESDRPEEPALATLMNRSLPDDPDRRAGVQAEVLKRYETAYVGRWKSIVAAWPAMEAFLEQNESLVERYAGMPPEDVRRMLADATWWNPAAHLTRVSRS